MKNNKPQGDQMEDSKEYIKYQTFDEYKLMGVKRTDSSINEYYERGDRMELLSGKAIGSGDCEGEIGGDKRIRIGSYCVKSKNK